MIRIKFLLLIGFTTLMAIGTSAWSANAVNIYSARHYQSDDKLYAAFTKNTGIQVNRIEAADEALLERLRSEGNNSPADVLILVDAARLSRAASEGLFAPSDSDILRQRIPERMRSSKESQGYAWWGFSTREELLSLTSNALATNRLRAMHHSPTRVSKRRFAHVRPPIPICSR